MKKSKFAKFVDATVGSALIFAAAYAVLRYFMPSTFAVLSAVSFTGAVWLILKTRKRASEEREKLSASAEDMFYEFMFMPDGAPAKLLMKGLQNKGITSAVHGNALYTDSVAAFFFFDAPPSEKAIARAIARAEHYKKSKAVIFSRHTPQAKFDVDFPVITAHGDGVYKLFASLKCLPKSKHKKGKAASRFAMFKGAFSKEKIPRYLLLSGAFFLTSALTGFSVVLTVCASVSAVLFLCSSIFAVAEKCKQRAE